MTAPTSPDPEGNRELLLTYLGEEEPVLYLDGITTDHGILEIFLGICGRESDAWLLRNLGLLPEWWRLVTKIQVCNLATHPDDEDRPEKDAQLRLADLTELERDNLRYGWRVHRTEEGGRILRSVDRRRPIQADPVLMMGLERVQRPVLGEHAVWPNVEVEAELVPL
jgi:hypothetical protein